MPKVISILFGALWTGAVCYAAGRLLLQRLRLKLYRQEEHLLGLVSGAVLVGLATFVLCAARAVYDATLLGLGAIVIIAAWRSGAFRSKAALLPPLGRNWLWFFLSLYVPFAFIAVVWAMAPENSPDGSSYHLGVVSRFYRAHGFYAMPYDMYGHLSQGFDMLFLHAFAFGRHSAAALFHCLFLLTSPLLILSYGRRAGAPVAGVIAGLLFFLTPVALIDGASAYNDVFIAMLLFSVFYVIEATRDEPSTGAALLSGVLCGGGFAAKYTAAISGLYAFPILVWTLARKRVGWRPGLRVAGAFAAGVVMIALPWVLRNSLTYGNPFSPLMNAWFPNPFITISFEQGYTSWLKMYPGVNGYADLFRQALTVGGSLSGHLGHIYYLAPIALLSLRSAIGRRLLLAGAVLVAPYFLNVSTRFLLPAIPFVALAMCMAPPARWAAALAPVVVLHAYLSLPSVGVKYFTTSWIIRSVPWRAALRLEPEQQYLARVSPFYRIAKMVEAATPEGSRILSFNQIPDAYTERDVRVSFQSAWAERMSDHLFTATDPNRQPLERLTFRFPSQRVSALRLVQTAPEGPQDVWSMTELRVFNGSKELDPDPGWKLRGTDSPWDLPLAFDGKPVTRWKAWRWLKPGWVEIEFDSERDVSEIAIDATADQYAIRLEVHGRTGTNGWRKLASEFVRSPLTPPLNLRCAAMRELRGAGVNYLLVNDGDFYWEDFRDKAWLWGMTEVGREWIARLYRLESECPITSLESTADSPPPRH